MRTVYLGFHRQADVAYLPMAAPVCPGTGFPVQVDRVLAVWETIICPHCSGNVFWTPDPGWGRHVRAWFAGLRAGWTARWRKWRRPIETVPDPGPERGEEGIFRTSGQAGEGLLEEEEEEGEDLLLVETKVEPGPQNTSEGLPTLCVVVTPNPPGSGRQLLFEHRWDGGPAMEEELKRQLRAEFHRFRGMKLTTENMQLISTIIRTKLQELRAARMVRQEEALARALETETGLRHIAAAMAQPVRFPRFHDRLNVRSPEPDVDDDDAAPRPDPLSTPGPGQNRHG